MKLRQQIKFDFSSVETEKYYLLYSYCFGGVRLPWRVFWLSMLKDFRLTGGIGARTAHNIH